MFVASLDTSGNQCISSATSYMNLHVYLLLTDTVVENFPPIPIAHGTRLGEDSPESSMGVTGARFLEAGLLPLKSWAGVRTQRWISNPGT